MDIQGSFGKFCARACASIAVSSCVVHGLSVGANKVFKKKPWASLERERHEKERTEPEESKRLARALRRDRKRQDAIAGADIDYAYEPLAAGLPSKPVRTVFDEDE